MIGHEQAGAKAVPSPSQQNFNLLLFSYHINQPMSATLPGQGCTKHKLHSLIMEGLNYNLMNDILCSFKM